MNVVACGMGRSLRATACLLLVALWSTQGHAATVAAVGTIDLIDRSNFVFHGTAVDRWVATDPSSGSIMTFVRFSVADVLKGDAGRREVVLGYLGGKLNGISLRVDGITLPRIGEEGVFFVERVERNQVHPLYGWDQGRFVISGNAQGGKIVLTHDLRPVRSFSSTQARRVLSTGIAEGIELGRTAREAMDLAQFMSRIREAVEARQ